MGEVFANISEADREHLLNRMNDYARKCQLGSASKFANYNIKDFKLHTWAGGAATTDTVTMNQTVLTTDVIVVFNLDSVAVSAVKGARASASTITLTTVGNGADGELFQVLLLHPVADES